jgi:hypothetical protein
MVAFASVLTLVSACGFTKAIDYSFFVPEHVEYELDGKCYGIENQPRERMLITDCSGYLNALQSTLTLGLSLSPENISKSYSNAARAYLDSEYEGCELSNITDLGGRIFEVYYFCEG